jgi:signal transduction histidine kinase
MNLVSNAIKFTDRGSVKIAARVARDGNVEIRVIDTGIGIKKEDTDKLFQPFQQIDMSLTRSREGTGLGLHLAKRLSALLGGDISAKSEYGRGSEFILTIPLRHKGKTGK